MKTPECPIESRGRNQQSSSIVERLSTLQRRRRLMAARWSALVAAPRAPARQSSAGTRPQGTFRDKALTSRQFSESKQFFRFFPPFSQATSRQMCLFGLATLCSWAEFCGNIARNPFKDPENASSQKQVKVPAIGQWLLHGCRVPIRWSWAVAAAVACRCAQRKDEMF